MKFFIEGLHRLDNLARMVKSLVLDLLIGDAFWSFVNWNSTKLFMHYRKCQNDYYLKNGKSNVLNSLWHEHNFGMAEDNGYLYFYYSFSNAYSCLKASFIKGFNIKAVKKVP